MDSTGILIKVLNRRDIKYSQTRQAAPKLVDDLSTLDPVAIKQRLQIALKSGRLSAAEFVVVKRWLDPSYKPPATKPKVLVRF